jgi:hypothetical protein
MNQNLRPSYPTLYPRRISKHIRLSNLMNQNLRPSYPTLYPRRSSKHMKKPAEKQILNLILKDYSND